MARNDRHPTRTEGAQRITSLDGLRGLAAMAVVLAHATGALAKPFRVSVGLHESPLAIFMNGTGGVHLFFVLSGFCLSASALRGRAALDLVQFYVRRVFRVHVPFVAALLLAWLASFLWYASPPAEGLTRWLATAQGVHLDLAHLGASLLFPGPAYNQMPIGWTLEVEMIFSLWMPLLIGIAVRFHWAWLLGAAAVALLGPELHHVQPYLLHFALGIAIFRESDRLERGFAATPRAARAALLLIGLAILTSPRFFRIEGSQQVLSTALFAGGSAILTAGAIHVEGLRRFLEWRPIAALGRVSYSVYLLHFTVVLFCAQAIDGRVGAVEGVLFVLASAALTVALAPLGYRFVERPAIDLGNRVCRALARRAGGVERPSHVGV